MKSLTFIASLLLCAINCHSLFSQNDCEQSFYYDFGQNISIPGEYFTTNNYLGCQINFLDFDNYATDIHFSEFNLNPGEQFTLLIENTCGTLDSFVFNADNPPIINDYYSSNFGFSIIFDSPDTNNLGNFVFNFLAGGWWDPPLSSVGYANTFDNQGIPYVLFDFSNAEDQTSCLTDTGGYCTSDQISADSINVTPSKNDDPSNGLTILDLIIMQRHILGIAIITDPYLLIAADVNQSGDISIEDLLELRSVILQIDDEFSNSPSWRFVYDCHEFEDPDNALQEGLPTTFKIANPIINSQFYGIKIGDLDQSASFD